MSMQNPPPLAGWWKCCSCAEALNNELAPERCSVCGHEKCSDCEDPCEILSMSPPSSPLPEDSEEVQESGAEDDAEEADEAQNS
jgi:hypothetical protein